MDIEKARDSLDHNFLTLKEYGFDKNFVLWVKLLTKISRVMCS